MRISVTSDHLKVHAVSGTYVVLLGFHLPKSHCDRLMGFSIHRADHTENEAYYLKGIKAFQETDPGLADGSLYSTKEHPIQSFQWADYSAKPGHEYTYTVSALKGTPSSLSAAATVQVRIATEKPLSDQHNVFFNRGISASQEYARRFGNKRPEAVPNNKAFEWLSRGAYEALEAYVNTCDPGVHALRIAAYEFHYEPFLQLLRSATDRGVDVQIIYDARKESPKKKNEKAIQDAGLGDFCTPRTSGKNYIAHNKFIVKLANGAPVSVWTGGMNFSIGGIFGHSNVAHVVNDPSVAETFLAYWNALKKDPGSRSLKPAIESFSPLPLLPLAPGTVAVFSPRKSLDALNLYARIASSAQNGLFMTFAFGMNQVFKEVFLNSSAPLRLALLEKAVRPMKEGPAKDAELEAIQQLRNMPQNVFAIGSIIPSNAFDGWVKETLSNLNRSVHFVHNKFMLVDPLGHNPVVVAGSANFSNASTTDNDENMVLICGDTRVADIYLGEFMRLFSHHTFRESLAFRKKNEPPKPLRTDHWWEPYFGNTSRSNRRKFFAQVEE